MKGQESPRITLEAIASGDNLPTWLLEALCEGECENHLFLYPNEGSRNQILHRLAQSNIPVDTTHHLTLQRLIPLMILDLSLQVGAQSQKYEHLSQALSSRNITTNPVRTDQVCIKAYNLIFFNYSRTTFLKPRVSSGTRCQ